MLAGFASAYAYFSRFERGERLGCIAQGLAARRRPLCQPCGDDGGRHRAVLCRGTLFRAARLSRRQHRLHGYQAPDGRSGARLHRHRRRLAISSAISTSCPCIWCCSLMLPAMMWLAGAASSFCYSPSRSPCGSLAGMFVIDMPNYPNAGGWFFNPFAWQLLFVIGFILGQRQREGKALAVHPLALLGLRRSIWSSPIWWVPFDWLINFSGINAAGHDLWDFDKGLCRLAAPPACAGARLCGDDVAARPWMHRIPTTNSSPPWAAIRCRSSASARSCRWRVPSSRHEWGGSFAHDTIIIATGLAVMGLLARSSTGASRAAGRCLSPSRRDMAYHPLAQDRTPHMCGNGEVPGRSQNPGTDHLLTPAPCSPHFQIFSGSEALTQSGSHDSPFLDGMA